MTTPIRLRSEAVDQLRRLTRLVSVELDRDVTQSDVLEQLAAFGLEHVGEIAGRLRAAPGDTPDGSPGATARPGTQSD
jgi:hypothetical protein